MADKLKIFTGTELLNHIESTLKDKLRVEPEQSNYGWLKTKDLHKEKMVEEYLETLMPFIDKLTPESCIAIIVKFETLAEQSTSLNDILVNLKSLLQEQENIQLLAAKVKKGKELLKRKEN